MRKSIKARLPGSDLGERIKSLHAKGWTNRQIADSTGSIMDTVRSWIRRLGLKENKGA